MLTLYGLKSCDSCRAARRWLDDASVAYRYHDVRDNGLDVSHVRSWLDETGWEQLVNKRSLTWRKIPEADRNDLDEQRAVKLLVEYPTLVKRPVLTGNGVFVVGFDAAAYARAFRGN